MKYEDIYKQAMKKVQAQPSWKQDTLQKMLDSQINKQVRFSYKKSAFVLVACFALLIITKPFISSFFIHSTDSPESFALSKDHAPMPKIALFNENIDLDLIDFSITDIIPYSIENLPEPVQITTDTAFLPVWKQETDTFTLLGEYPLISSTEAIDSSMITMPSQRQKTDMVVNLVYVQSAGYLQPAYSVALQSSDLPLQYVPAIGGEYYK